LQVMGMLESQTLDFKNVILLGANEDFLPAGKSSNSFIPYEIRRKFLLPTYHESNAVYAYHFYRLLQRAEKIIIQYNSEPGELGGGDRSRFIAQLQYELPKFNHNITIQERILSIPIIAEKTDDRIEIAKTPEILNQLRDHADYGFSASALNSFRNCTLQFYFKYIAGLDEVDEPEETIEASTLGSVVHEVLAGLFEPFKGMKLLTEDFDKMKLLTESFIGKAFENNFPNGDINFGKNLLILKVANQYVINFLEREIQFLRNTKADGGYLIIRELEKSFSAKLLIEFENKGFEAKLTGRFDRIDENSGTVRIIDFKTGQVDVKDLKLKSWEDLLTESKLDKCFQLLLYAYIYRNQDPHNLTPIIPGIISFRSLSSGMMNLLLPENELLSQEALVRFESVLKSIIANVFNPDLPFCQTEIIENCQYCAFAQICNRN
jgi:ATP-dependent helicase/nuclease subunit B